MMRVLVAKNAKQKEPLIVGEACADPVCECLHSWVGIFTGELASIAVVQETPDGFELPDGIDGMKMASLGLACRAAKRHPVGTELVINYDRKTTAWEIDVA